MSTFNRLGLLLATKAAPSAFIFARFLTKPPLYLSNTHLIINGMAITAIPDSGKVMNT